MSRYDDGTGMWGGAGRDAGRLSLLELVRNGALDIAMASILWLLVEKKASLVVAAGPRQAGKTTMLTAIMDFAPPRHTRVYTRGVEEDFSFLEESRPSDAYLMVPELSDHTPAYLWGGAAHRLFEILGEVYSVAATIHADSPGEVTAMLVSDPVGLTGDLLAKLDAVVNLGMVEDDRGITRKLSSINVLDPAASGYVSLARWDPGSDSFSHNDTPEAMSALAARVRLSAAEVTADLARRSGTLTAWMSHGSIAAEAVQRMVREHYGGSSLG